MANQCSLADRCYAKMSAITTASHWVCIKILTCKQSLIFLFMIPPIKKSLICTNLILGCFFNFSTLVSAWPPGRLNSNCLTFYIFCIFCPTARRRCRLAICCGLIVNRRLVTTARKVRVKSRDLISRSSAGASLPLTGSR